MSKQLEGKIALVTGGSRGIGAAIAKRLAADGANVALTYTKGADAAASVVKEIERAGGKAIAIQADAADAGAVEAAVEKTVSTFGQLDVLVNNAGTAIPKPFEETTLEEMDLGHLGIQFAKKFGYRVAAVGRGSGNAALAKKLGADAFIDSAATDPADELQKLGGATVILATAPSGKAMSALVGGLGVNGTMVVVGASMDPIEVSPNQLLFGKKGIKGWAGGIPTDSQDTLRFAEMTGVRPMIETYPLAKAAAGYGRMMS